MIVPTSKQANKKRHDSYSNEFETKKAFHLYSRVVHLIMIDDYDDDCSPFFSNFFSCSFDATSASDSHCLTSSTSGT